MTDEQFDPLVAFARWFLTSVPALGRIPHEAPCHTIENVTSVTLFRQPPFQVQMFIGGPGNVIPEHTHPNVDSIEVYAGGHIRFSKDGKWVQPDLSIIDRPTTDGTSFLRGGTIRVRPNDPHGGVAGTYGAVFLSIQHWLNGVEPSCVACDYVGVAMGEDHRSKVIRGEATVKTSLTLADVATKEAA